MTRARHTPNDTDVIRGYAVTMTAVQAAAVSSLEIQLSERDMEVLAFERQWWKYAGAKEEAVRDLFGLNATEYYQVLNALIDNPAALAHDPMLIKRLRRMRSARQRGRAGRSVELSR